MEKSDGIISESSYKKASTICVPYSNVLETRGIFFGYDPFDFVFPTVMAKIITIALLSHFLYFVLRPFKQPKFICYFLVGFILGPSLLGHNETIKKLFPAKERELLVTLSMLGALYYTFIMGVKMDLSLIIRLVKPTWRIGLLGGFLCPLVVSSTLYFALFHPFPAIALNGMSRLFVPMSLSYTFFPPVAEGLKELDLLDSELGQIAMSSAVLNDVVFWLFSVLSVAFRQDTTRHGIQAFISFMAFVVFTYLFIRPTMLLILRRTPEGKPIKEFYVIILLVGVLVMSAISDMIGAKPMFGALIFGLIVPAGPPLGAAIVQRAESILFQFFLPMFYLHVGRTIDVRLIGNWDGFIRFQITIVVAILAKVVGVVLASYSCSIRLKHGLLLGAIMNIKGIHNLIQFYRWKNQKLIDDQTYSQIMLSTIGVTMIVMPLIHYLRNPILQLNLSLRQEQGPQTIQSLPRNTEFRILSCIHNEESVHSIINLFEASHPTKCSPIRAYIVQASELVGLFAPILVPYDKRRRKLRLAFSAQTDHIIRAFENYSLNSRGPVKILPFIMVASYKSMHQKICRIAQDKLIPLIIVPFHHNQRFSVNSSTSKHIQQFNVNVQHFAPCTVGILVDRGFSSGKISNKISYHIAVVFIGGPDDREALSFVNRMSDLEGLRITVLRIILQNGKEMSEDEERELCFDQSTVDEFKLKTMWNYQVSWSEIEAWDGVGIMSAVKYMEGQFDLVVAGRRQKEMAAAAMGEDDDEMFDFVENQELGVIGDLLSSPDFCEGNVSVLVMQHSKETKSNSKQTKISWKEKLFMFPHS
ncbi:hypothetical protein UlMin_025422 [Ulmus minor]